MISSKVLQFDSASAAIQSAERILVVTHLSPDGDAIGSLLGITNALRTMGKSVDCAVDEGNLDYLGFLPGAELIQAELKSGDWDLMISVDASDEERTGKAGIYGREHAPKVINLDHHPTNTLFGDIHLIDPVAVSATQVIFDWLIAMDFPLTKEIAAPLLTGLITDTLGLRTNNVTERTLEIAQALMKAGASLTEITQRTLDNKSFQQVSLWKYALATVELHEAGVVVAEVKQEDLKRSGLRDMTDAGLVSFLISVDEAMISVVFKEDQDDTVKLSLRAKPGFDVSKVALEFGGGGHTLASGATIPGNLEEARKKVLPKVIIAARQGKLAIG